MMQRTTMTGCAPLVPLNVDVSRIPGCEIDARAYVMGECRIIASENHISVSCANRYPTWDEIAAIKESLTEDESEWFMVLPKRSQYVNIHHTTLHIWSRSAIQST